MKTNTLSTLLFVILLTLGTSSAFARVVASNPNEPITEHTFRVEKLPRSTTYQDMKAAGYRRISVAEGGWDNTKFYNYVGRGRAKVMIFPADTYLWCTPDGTPVYRDICFNPIEALPQEQAAYVPAYRCTTQEYVQGSFDYCGTVQQYANCLQGIQQWYPNYYQPMCSYVQGCVPQSTYTSINKTVNITNVNVNTNTITNVTTPSTPQNSYCPPAVAQNSGAVVPSNGSTTPFPSPTDATNGSTVAGHNQAATVAGTNKVAKVANVSPTTAPVTTAGAIKNATNVPQAKPAISYLNGKEVRQATVPTTAAPITHANAAQIAKAPASVIPPASSVMRSVQTGSPVTRAAGNVSVPHSNSVIPPASSLISYRGAGNSPVTHASSFIPQASSISVPRANSISVPHLSSTHAAPMMSSMPKMSMPSMPRMPSFSGGGSGGIKYLGKH